MVVTPFVPGLGELMLVYTALQLANDVLEGIVDLAEGQVIEGAEHFIGVASDLIQFAIFAAGGEIVSVFKRSAFVDGLRAVKVGDQQRLWNPDLAPYAKKDLQLPSDSRPDELGLHSHQEQKSCPWMTSTTSSSTKRPPILTGSNTPPVPRPIHPRSTITAVAPGPTKGKTRTPGTVRPYATAWGP